MNSFGNLFTYRDYKLLPDGNVVYYTCVLPSGTVYTSIELDIKNGSLVYYHNNTYFGTFSIQHQGTRS
jgi:hypothetical protein